MRVEHTSSNYKIFRFLFSFALLVTFSIFAGTAGLTSTAQIIAAFILFIYTAISFLTIFIGRVTVFDTLLDITFITAFIFTDFDRLKYFSLLYLFPLFFTGFTFNARYAFMVALTAVMEYFLLFFFYREYTQTGYLNLFLNTVAFLLITTAGVKLKQQIEKQQKYIRKLEDEKRESEVYKKLYRISAELAHEIRNPLASIKAAADLLAEGNPNPRLVKMIKEESARLNKLLSDFLLLSRPKESEKVNLNVGDITHRLKELYQKDREISVNIDGSPVLYISEKGFESALSNVIKNAVEWSREKVQINVYSSNNKLFIEVEDDGPGIPEENRDRIFDPFFTTNSSGTGLGLAIAKRVVMENGGNIFVEESPLGGAKFILTFPLENKDESTGGRRRD
ncbi:MAG: HAMP domain-containing histidine kinase [Aquificae bacterium]|nr:HAMP domain-containing histidine kinase [Aquificota bacterium]